MTSPEIETVPLAFVAPELPEQRMHVCDGEDDVVHNDDVLDDDDARVWRKAVTRKRTCLAMYALLSITH